MLRRLFFISAILILAFTITTFGQSNKRTLFKAKKVTQTKKGVSEWTDILAKKTNKRKPNPKLFIDSPTDGNGIRKAAPRNGTSQRKGGITHTDSWNSKTKRKPTNHSSYTAGGTWVSGDATGLRKGKGKTTRKPCPKSIVILDQDGETEVARKKRKRNK
ncbi:MAG: hypothetical protein AAB336_07450 [Acidobacteriota bacterium]